MGEGNAVEADAGCELKRLGAGEAERDSAAGEPGQLFDEPHRLFSLIERGKRRGRSLRRVIRFPKSVSFAAVPLDPV